MEYFNFEELYKRYPGDIYIIIGERSNGKSFSAKNFLMKESYTHIEENTHKFGYIRRLEDEIKKYKVTNYFKDCKISSITNNKYNIVETKGNEIKLAFYNTKSKLTLGDTVGYKFSLSTEQNDAGGVYTDIDFLLFDEFITRKIYLNNEPLKLMNLYCTIDRKRGSTKLIMLGNTINQVCPYFSDWGIDEIIHSMRQGETVKHTIKDKDNIERVIIIHYCKDSGKSSYTIGTSSDMLSHGKWQVDDVNVIYRSHKDNFIQKFKIKIFNKKFIFTGLYLYDIINKVGIWYIYPNKYRTSIYRENTLVFPLLLKNKTPIISDISYPNPYVISSPYHFKNTKINKFMGETFTKSNIYFSDKLTGTNFYHAINFNIKE